MKRKVLIAGAGQLGSRYLQGLSKVREALDIYVFDLSVESLTRAEQRWSEMHPAAEHDVHYVSVLSALPVKMDLAIVATTADVRTVLVAEIANHANIRYWVLEKVLTQSSAEITELQKLLGGDKSAWVNTPMHLWSLYCNIRALYPTGKPIEATFEGFRGLACNAIHYVDFVSRWNGAPPTEVDASGLQSEWYPAKRDGFYEIDGKIRLQFADGSKLNLASERNNLGYKVKLKIDGDEWQVSESEGVALSADGRRIEGGIQFQSALTAPMIEAIFNGTSCGLPSLQESAQQHGLFLNTLLDHWNRHMPEKRERLPIT
jgi:hypothetical protein